MSRLEELLRWVEFGGAWEVVARRGEVRVISLLRCDGGEEVSRLIDDDSELRDYVDARCQGLRCSDADARRSAHGDERTPPQHSNSPPVVA